VLPTITPNPTEYVAPDTATPCPPYPDPGWCRGP
jgi:hypothetical protein